MADCMLCRRTFSTRSNLYRHQRGFHKMKVEEVDSSEDEDSPAASSEEEDSPGPLVIDEDSSGEEAAQEEASFWRAVLYRVYGGMDFPKGKGATEVLASEAELNRIAEEVYKEVLYVLNSEKFLRNNSEVFSKLFKSYKKLHDETNYTEDEASVKAFHLRRNLFTNLVKANGDLLKNEIGDHGL